MHEILCSTGALITRSNGRDHRLLEKFAPKLDCSGFEFMIYDSWYDKLDEILSDVASMSLNIPALHCEKTIGEYIARDERDEAMKRFEQNCHAACALGAKLIVLHLWNGIISDSNFSANLRAYEWLRKISDGYGLLLTIENVVCHSSPQKHLYELLDAYPDISFTFDTKMAQFHGELDKCYDETLWKKHFRHLHINDYDGGVMDWSSLKTRHLGEGQVDLKGFFEYANKMKYSGDFTVESSSVGPDGLVDFDKLNRDFDVIRGYIA